MKRYEQHGFNIVSALLTIVAVLLVVGIAYMAINPGKKAAEKRNVQRIADITAILHAVDQYTRANQTIFPKTITTKETEICQLDASDCTGLVDLSVVKPFSLHFPVDPSLPAGNSTGYAIRRAPDNHITIFAPHAENGAVIQATW